MLPSPFIPLSSPTVPIGLFFKNIGIRLPYNPSIPLLGIYSDQSMIETNKQTKHMYPKFHSRIINNS